MPRLIAIEGDEAGLALPVSGPLTFLGIEGDGRLRLLPGGPPPARGAAFQRVGAAGYVVGACAGGELELNGAPLTQSAPLRHGDLLTLGGTTLIYDDEDNGQSQTHSEDSGFSAQAAEFAPPARSSSESKRTPASPPTGEPPLSGDSILYRLRAFEDAGEVVATLAGDEGPASAARLATLLRIADAVGASLDLPAVLTTLLDHVFDAVPASRGMVLLVDAERRALRSSAAKVRGERARTDAHIPVSRTMIGEALRTREAILTLDAQSDARFARGESIVATGMRSAVCAPILRNGRLLGVLHVDAIGGDQRFGADHVQLLAAISGVAGLAIDNARLYEQVAERERLAAEVRLARSVQDHLLPKAAPRVAGLSVFGLSEPALELGGDVFDFVVDPLGRLHVLVGDVSGKGIGAGLIMATGRSYFRALTATAPGPRALMARLNRLLFADTQSDKFMSAVYLLWDPASGRLVSCGAGQEHLLFYRAASGTCEAQRAGGVALAVVEDAERFLEETELALAPGDAVVLYTDGITEARGPDGEFFELERLQGLVARCGAAADAEAVARGLVAGLDRYCEGVPRHDDVTAVVVKRM